MSKQEPERFLTIAKAAERVDVHPITIRRWIKSGRLVAHRMGPRLIKVDAQELEAMLTPVGSDGDTYGKDLGEQAELLRQAIRDQQALSVRIAELEEKLRGRS